MSTINPAAPRAPEPPLGSAQQTPAGKIPNNPKGQLGKDQFLQLLVAQMKHQDPLNPMDGQEMAAQLAQFSSVEQLVTINESIANQAASQSALLDSLGGGLALGAIGKEVEADASQATTLDGKPVPAGTEVKGRVDGVRFTPDGPVLTIGNYSVPFSAVRTITQPAG
jgi:flagellar basal-body rod modification protein FlgD